MKTINGWRRALTAVSFVALGAAFSFPATVQAADLLAQAKANGTLRVANTQSSPPWSMLDDSNNPVGYDVAIAKEVGKRIGVPNVVFVADSFKNFVEGLKTGKYDLVMNDLTPTPEREQQVDFSDPYGVEDFRIFVPAGNTDIKGKDTLKGKRVGVVTGSSNETWARAHLKDSDIRSYDNGALIFNDLGSGRIDAVIISHFGGMKYANVNHLPVKEVGDPLIYQLSAPAIVKGQPALRAAVNKAIAEMMADGTIEAIAKKWVGSDYDMAGMIAKAKAQKE
ncbi:ABC transporter substrate-binding protein [Paraburkholderia phenazinium]|jgi:cystine transport system substrate-binding protein|uniref:Amino acid ABC transporter substrate-binding protein, PAAT family n=1 Tax=Paraburkholderia phenazinium TaxID=60549 RepID=A0A1G7SIA5_9BURK|nr:ABC transporter substrate-binding protein [Paraburkholderia phenazinium]SDG22701.1 amino acid ABC transporter substrate-binding protein, PAAT family [Paraburkholderia phenazinium]